MHHARKARRSIDRWSSAFQLPAAENRGHCLRLRRVKRIAPINRPWNAPLALAP